MVEESILKALADYIAPGVVVAIAVIGLLRLLERCISGKLVNQQGDNNDDGSDRDA